MLSHFYEKAKGFLKFIPVAFIFTAVGAMFGPYVDFQKENRAALAADITRMNDTSQSFLALLRPYADRTVRGASIDAQADKNFQESFTKLYRSAEFISEREPSMKPNFDRFAQSLVNLHEAAKNLHGPMDGRDFVEATSAFAKEQRAFEDQASKLNQSFLHALFGVSV